MYQRSNRGAWLAVLGLFAAGCPSTGIGNSDFSTGGDAPSPGLGGFGAPCVKNGDCSSLLCLPTGHCSKPCAQSSDCPPGPEWTCASSPGVANNICQCTPSGPEMCDGRDHNCDTLVGNVAGCCSGTPCADGGAPADQTPGPPLDLTAAPDASSFVDAIPPAEMSVPLDFSAPAPDASVAAGDLPFFPDLRPYPDLRPAYDGGYKLPAHPTIRVEVAARTKVDVLFMVDNSFSMQLIQEELRNRFSVFDAAFQAQAAKGVYYDLHIGVVTSDYGAGSTGAPGCEPSPGGQRGKLQALGANHAAGCVAPAGANYIQYVYGPQGPSASNLPTGKSLVDEFSCIAAVGQAGCGFEHQMESVYAALHDNLAENAGFVRGDALLAVVYFTNEDDSSAPIDSDIFDKNKVAQYGYEDSYRQTRFGVMCGSPPMSVPYGDSNGPLSNCIPAPNPNNMGPGREYDVSRYSNLFTLGGPQGGIKANPLDVLLVGMDAPESPVQVILSNPGTPPNMPYVPCPQLNENQNPPCVPVLQHSCQNAQTPGFFGDPSVRLNAVINSVRSRALYSICNNDDTAALQGIAALIQSNSGLGCVPSPLADPKNADCAVEDVTQNADGSVTLNGLPRCDKAPGVYPCWRVDNKPSCSGTSPQSLGITVDRNGKQPPANTTSLAQCN